MLIVGIAGGTGSGKTTVVKKVVEVFPNDEVNSNSTGFLL